MLSACSESGTPVPGGAPETTTTDATPPTTTSSAQDDRFGAPDVESPLDAAKQLDDPCTSLTSSQVSGLGLREPAIPGDKSSFDDLGPYCSWRDTANEVDFTVAYIVPNQNGLADLYRGQETGQWAYWEPTTVNGYPGVFQAAADQRQRGQCTVSVGVNDELHFSVTSRRGDPDKACDQVKDIASAVVDTLKGGG
ncbi:DUF3558 domain-containing protein [Actinokineospora guangxiensis]|uniref:DUF3558 domain-containing protein n=1 Tax=Actinokineospora guangxiensis TaxID=1490288 RepID=A0ABW0ELV4_9PSEU